MSKENIVLSFHENLLRETDVMLLRGPCCLNDNIISFYFEYLDSVLYKNEENMLFVSPEVTQCCKLTTVTDIPIFLDPLHAAKKNFIFFPLNDNERRDSAGGSHWSLLLFSHPDKWFYHFDSHGGLNRHQAKEFSDKLSKYLGVYPNNHFSEYESLQQSNGYDCGVHVLCNADLIARHVNLYHSISGCGIVDRQMVLRKRKDLLDLIYSLKNS